MARKKTQKAMRRELVDTFINAADNQIKQEQAAAQAQLQAQAQEQTQPEYAKGLTRADVDNILNSYQPQQEIPKLEQNTTPSITDELERMKKAKADTTTPRTEGEQKAIDTYYDSLLKASGQGTPTSTSTTTNSTLEMNTPTTDYKAEIDRMNALKADTSATRTEGENKAIDEYLKSLEEAQAYVDSQKPKTTSSASVKKPENKKVETPAIIPEQKKTGNNLKDSKFGRIINQRVLSTREQEEYEKTLKAQGRYVGQQAKENAQPRERALSANEQRDYDRAQEAIAKAKENDLRKKYDDRGFLLNTPITDNQETVDFYNDPNEKLTKYEVKDAERLIDEYEKSELGQKNENATTLVFDEEHPDGIEVPVYTVDDNGVYHPERELTPEERAYQQSIGELKTKVKDSESALVGAMQTVPFVDALNRAGDTDGSYERMVANAQKQNPLSYWAGLLGTGLAMNTAGQFALNGTQYGDWLNKVAGVDKAGISDKSRAIRKTLAQAATDVPVDLATDIIPTLTSDLAQDKSAGEVIGNTAFNIGLNGLFNLVPAAASNWSDIAPRPEVWLPQKKAAQETVENIIPVVDDIVPQEAKVIENAKQAVNEIPEVKPARTYDDIVKEGEALEKKYKNLTKYSEEPVTVTKQEVPEDILKYMTGDNYENELESVKLGTEFAKRGYNVLENGGNNNILNDEWSILQDTVAHHLTEDLIPASTMAEAYDTVKQSGGTLNDAIRLAAEKTGTKLAAGNENVGSSIILGTKKAPKEITSLNPDINSAIDTEIRKSVERNSSIDVKSVKAANKKLDNNINGLVNMFGKQKYNEGVVAMKEALNEYAETGSEEALARARQIASEMDQYYANTKYVSKRGNTTNFGNGSLGTFTSQVDDYADTLKGKSSIIGNKVNAPDLDERINNLFTKYDLSGEDAESVGNLKQAINNYIADPSDTNWESLMTTASDVSKRSGGMSEYVSSYKGKVKSNPFDTGEMNEIIDDVVRRGEETKKSMPLKVDRPANPRITSEPIPRKPANGGNVPPANNVPPTGNVPPTNNVPPTPNNPVPPIPEGNGELVERGASRHIRSVNDVTEYTPMKYDVPDEVSNEFIDNPDMYKRLKNADTQARADAIYERGGDVENIFRRMLGQKDPASLALGHRIAKDYSAKGQYEKAAQIYRDMGKELTQAGQFSQASVLAMMKNDPLTALYYAQKEIDKLNVDGAKRFGKKWKDFELTPEEVKAFGKIDPGDEKTIAEMYDKIGARLGKEYPTTVMDKLLEARRVSMLFNLRTNLRNFFANVPTLGMRWISDRLDAVGQHYAHLLDPSFEVTNSVRGAGIRGRKLANQVYNSDAVQAMLKNTNGKYSPEITNSLMQNKQIFKGNALEKWINRNTGGGIEKINKALFGKEGVESGLETIRNATYAALELGDSPFVKENFVERLGSYINARGIKNIKDIPDDAIQVAWEEAMKATYKDNSWAVKMLRGFKNGMESIPGVGRPISQATIPFLQAPGNIAARMVDYSPIKATKGIVDMISGANSGNLNAVRKGIEEFSKGATGTGMILLGMKLKESGLITGDYSQDKDQRNFEKQSGFKPYALHIGDKYFTYDWAQPFAEPMIIGTLLQEAIDNSDQFDSDILKYFGKEGTTAGKLIGGAREGIGATVNSWFNASPLQGLADLMKSDYTGDKSIAENIYDKTVVDFASSFIPSLVNSTAKSVDPTMRNTYDPSNTFGTFLNEQAAKLPGLSDNLPAKFDTWGNEMTYADSKGEAFARKFIVPGDYGKMSDDPVDQEINNLFNDTSDNRVFPLTAPNAVDGVKLDNKEVSAYQEDMGKRSREIVESFMDSDYYNDLEDKEKAETLNTIYSVSKAITERDLFDKEVADNSTYKKAIEAYDTDGAEGLMNYLEGKAIEKEAGVSSTSKASQFIQDLLKSGDKEGARQLSDDISYLRDEGLDTKQQGVYASRGSNHYTADEYAALYDEINTDDKSSITQKEAITFLNDNFNGSPEDQREALQVYESMVTDYKPGESKFARFDPEKGKYVAADPKDAKNQFRSTLIPKVEPVEEQAPVNQDKEWENATLSNDPYTAIAQSGVGHNNGFMNEAWDKAIKANSSLTPQEFIDTWAAIDSSGNGKHDKNEFRNYLNNNNISEDKGNLILDMYYPTNWGRIKYNNGTWY